MPPFNIRSAPYCKERFFVILSERNILSKRPEIAFIPLPLRL